MSVYALPSQGAKLVLLPAFTLAANIFLSLSSADKKVNIRLLDGYNSEAICPDVISVR